MRKMCDICKVIYPKFDDIEHMECLSFDTYMRNQDKALLISFEYSWGNRLESFMLNAIDIVTYYNGGMRRLNDKSVEMCNIGFISQYPLPITICDCSNLPYVSFYSEEGLI